MKNQAAEPADNMLFWYVAGDMVDQTPAVIKESEEGFGTAELFKETAQQDWFTRTLNNVASENKATLQAAIESVEPKKADALINDRGLDKTFRGSKIEQTLQAVVLKPKANPKKRAAPKAVA